MASRKVYQDESIQLIHTSSSQENISNVESSSPSILKLKRKNKIYSPPPLSPSISLASSNDVSDLFRAKTVKILPPVPRPRTSIIKKVQTTSFIETDLSDNQSLSQKSDDISDPPPNQKKKKPKTNKKKEPSKFVESDNPSVASHKSETMSYKEQLRNRFLSVKKQAGSSISQTPVKKSSRKSKHSINENILDKENEFIEYELKKHVSRTSNDINEGFNFFCNNVVEEKNIEQTDTMDEDKEIHEAEIDVPEDDKDSIIEFLGLDIRDTDIIENVPGYKINIAENEQELFWKPSGKLDQFKDDENEPRCLEEEGIYRANEPQMPKKQLNILKEKLLMDENREWFEEDGRLKVLPDPRLNKSFKPFKSTDLAKDFTENLATENIIPTVYEPVDFRDEFSSKNIFEIQLYSIKFDHHSLFSPEHVLAQKLSTFYDKFLEKKTANKCTMLQKTLEALIFAKNRLKNNLAAGDSSNLQTEKYQTEINDVRKKMYEEGKNYRDLIKSILHIWKAIKTIRNEQKFINTPVKLLIKKEYDDYETEKLKWVKNIEEEISDFVAEYEKNFQNEITKFKSDLKEWKIKKRNITEEDEDELPEKPKKPKRNIDIEKIKLEIIEKCEQCLKHPGEPILDFELINDNEIITNDVVTPKELLRRAAVNKTQIYTKIMFNKQEICKSKSMNLNNNFICEFNEPFSIQIVSKPKQFTLDIYEQSGSLSKRLLYQIQLLDKKEDDEIKRELFFKKEKIHNSHTGVGSNVNTKNIFKSYDIDISDEIIFTSGNITWNYNWIYDKINKKSIQPICVPSMKLLDVKNISTLSKSFIDPQDPQNALIYEYIKNVENIDENQDYFRLEPEMKALELCDISEIDNNPRFKMLMLRDRNEPEFQGVIVPNRVKEIPDDAFEAYEKRCEESEGTFLIEEFRKDDIDGQRKWGMKHLQQAENKVIQLSKAAENKISLQDVFTEDSIPTLSSLGITFMNWLQPNRPLRPTRRAPKHTQSSLSMKDAKIIINIIGAIQVPVRKDTDMISSNDQISMIPVRPFVIAMFKDQQARTTVAEGANPIWNQELTLPLENLSETALQNLRGTLHLHLYDETISDLTEDDRLRHTNIHQQLGYNWLGGLNFPINTLLYNKRIEGTFKLNSPAILLGYESNTTQFYTDTVSHRQDTYLTIFLTIQPSIERIRKIQPCLECNEMQYVEEHIKNWEQEYKIIFPHRYFSSLVANMNGEMSCVTRYFKPVVPPQIDQETEITEELCTRFVSMIPFRENTLCHKIPTIWLTAEQLLTLSLGSVTDHAILLICFFMAIEIKCWLLLGYGIPHGYTSYVLVREKNSLGHNVYFVYDVENAFKYSIQDNFCPLQKVFCVINDENVWGNLQIEDRAHMTKFDLAKTSEWLPLFGRTISAPTLTSQQKISIMFIETPSVISLQEKIEKKLRQKIMKWRKHHITVWNHYCSSVLKQMLPKLEINSLQKNNSMKGAKDFEELRGLFNSYKMRGFAINLPYTSIKQICSYVRATRIHCNENPNTEFALGVYVHSYPNYTLVVWLYLAALIRRR